MDLGPRAAGPSQPQTGRGVGQSPTVQFSGQFQRDALGSFTEPEPSSAEDSPIPSDSISPLEIQSLVEFFQTLDRWERELRASNAHGAARAPELLLGAAPAGVEQ
jgi:hypothetical protein